MVSDLIKIGAAQITPAQMILLGYFTSGEEENNKAQKVKSTNSIVHKKKRAKKLRSRYGLEAEDKPSIAMQAIQILHPHKQENPDKRPLSKDELKQFRRAMGSNKNYSKAFNLLFEFWKDPSKSKKQRKSIELAADLVGLHIPAADDAHNEFKKKINSSKS